MGAQLRSLIASINIVDLLFVDPPYNINKVFGKTTFKKMDNDHYEAWARSWLNKVVDKLKPNASIYVCGDWRSILFKLSEHFRVRNRITWEREKREGRKIELEERVRRHLVRNSRGRVLF